MFKFFRKFQEKGICPICKEIDSEIVEEPLVNLLGIKVCEGCYHDLINEMGYKNLNDLLECDKKQLNLFLNLLAKHIKNS